MVLTFGTLFYQPDFIIPMRDAWTKLSLQDLKSASLVNKHWRETILNHMISLQEIKKQNILHKKKISCANYIEQLSNMLYESGNIEEIEKVCLPYSLLLETEPDLSIIRSVRSKIKNYVNERFFKQEIGWNLLDQIFEAESEEEISEQQSDTSDEEIADIESKNSSLMSTKKSVSLFDNQEKEYLNKTLNNLNNTETQQSFLNYLLSLIDSKQIHKLSITTKQISRQHFHLICQCADKLAAIQPTSEALKAMDQIPIDASALLIECLIAWVNKQLKGDNNSPIEFEDQYVFFVIKGINVLRLDKNNSATILNLVHFTGPIGLAALNQVIQNLLMNSLEKATDFIDMLAANNGEMFYEPIISMCRNFIAHYYEQADAVPIEEPLRKKRKLSTSNTSSSSTLGFVSTPFHQMNENILNDYFQNLDHPQIKEEFAKYLHHLIISTKNAPEALRLLTKTPPHHLNLVNPCVLDLMSLNLIHTAVDAISLIPSDQSALIIKCLYDWFKGIKNHQKKSGVKHTDNDEYIHLDPERTSFPETYIPFAIRCLEILKKQEEFHFYIFFLVYHMGSVGELSLQQFIKKLLNSAPNDAFDLMTALQHKAQVNESFQKIISKSVQEMIQYSMKKENYQQALQLMSQHPYVMPELKPCCQNLLAALGPLAADLIHEYASQLINPNVKSAFNRALVEYFYIKEQGYKAALNFIKSNAFTDSDRNECLFLCFKDQFTKDREAALNSLTAVQHFQFDICIYEHCCQYAAEQLIQNDEVEGLYETTFAFLQKLGEEIKASLFLHFMPTLLEKRCFEECSNMIDKCQNLDQKKRAICHQNIILAYLKTPTETNIQKAMDQSILIPLPQYQRESRGAIFCHLLKYAKERKKVTFIQKAQSFVRSASCILSEEIQKRKDLMFIEAYLSVGDFSRALTEMQRLPAEQKNQAAEHLIQAYLNHDKISEAFSYVWKNHKNYPTISAILVKYIKELHTQGKQQEAKVWWTQLPDGQGKEGLKTLFFS